MQRVWVQSCTQRVHYYTIGVEVGYVPWRALTIQINNSSKILVLMESLPMVPLHDLNFLWAAQENIGKTWAEECLTSTLPGPWEAAGPSNSYK